MRIRPDQLESHLRQQLLPLYFVSGDEPLQLMEAGDAVRRAARAAGHGEREVFQVESGFDWNSLRSASGNLSLFSERRLLELRLPSGKPGDAGAKVLAEYAASPTEDTLLLIISGRLEKRQQQTKWFKALDQAGAVVQVWPVEHTELPGWTAGRCRARGIEISTEAARLLAERVEGNLLAAAQEVEKLHLLYGEGKLDVEQVLAAVGGSSRYNPFLLLESALLGDGPRAIRILDGLRGEGTEPLAILGALVWEIRNVTTMAADAASGGIEQAMARGRVWDKRKQAIRAALQRHPARRWQQLLARCARIDRMAKGRESGNAWDELVQLTLLIAGQRLF